MSTSIIFYSKKPLDIGAFHRCFEKLGDASIRDGFMQCHAKDESWSYDFYFGDNDPVDYSPEEISRIAAFIEAPRFFVASLVHHRQMPDQLLLCLPEWDDVWISEEADFLFSLKEVKQRIKLGIEYYGRPEREAGADLMVNHKGQVVGGAMVMIDPGKESDTARREATFREKLARFAPYFARTEALWKSAGFRSENPLIEVLYVVPPTPAMRAITSVSDPAHPEFVFPVEFVTEDEFRERHGFVPRDLPSLRDRY